LQQNNQDNNFRRNNNIEELEIDLREYILLLWRKKMLLIGLVIAAVLIAFLYTGFFLAEEYETYATIELSNIDHRYARPNNARSIIKSEELAGSLIREIERENDWTEHRVRSFINNNIEVEALEDTDMLNIIVSGNNPTEISRLANELAENFLEISRERSALRLEQKENRLAKYQERIEFYDDKVKEAENEILNIYSGELEQTAEIMLSSSISERIFNYIENLERAQDDFYSIEEEIQEMEEARIISTAFTPGSPTAPNRTLNMAIAAVLALMLGVFGVFFREFLREE